MAKLNWYRTGQENRISRQGSEFLKSDPFPKQPSNIIKPKSKKSSTNKKRTSNYIYIPSAPKKTKKNLKTCPICRKKFETLSKHVRKCLSEYEKSKKSKPKARLNTVNKGKYKIIVQDNTKSEINNRIRRIPNIFLLSIKNNKQLKGFVVKENKGGFIVKINKFPAFCPRSHMYPPDQPLSFYKKKKLSFFPLEISEHKAVVSRKIAVKLNTLDFLRNAKEQNDTLTVRVKNIQSYGVFVNYGLVDGFIHISKIPSVRIDDINKIVKIHQRLDVKVLEIKNDDRVTFTML